MYEKVAVGTRIIDIVRSLNERGIKTRRGFEWNKSSFNKMLQNERYRGIYIYNDMRIEGGMPRIISDELFYKVQEAIKMKPNPRCTGRRHENSVYLLTGKLFCGHCLSPMVGDSGKSHTGAMHYYYKCQKRKKQHICNKRNVQRDYIETLIAKKIYEHCLQDDIMEKIADATVERNIKRLKESNVGTLEEELNDVNKRIGNLMKAMEAGAMSQNTIARFHELEDQQMKLNIKLNDAKVHVVSCSKEQLMAGMRVFRKLDVEDKKSQAELFDMFLKAAFLYDDKLRIVFQIPNEHDSVEVPIERMAENKGLEEIRDTLPEKFGQKKICSTKLYSSTFTMSGVVKK